ncbi:hypothetical protein [Massilia sp.]|uniref:hypothetical protein n=1 Tax=Massilia sp. TaxID=1882437 RepID=UPI0028A08EE7|nr:hypothetical protein [Massilia sp.]
MQGTQPPATAPSPADPGFKLPEESASPQDSLPQTAPDTAARPVEVMPVNPNSLPVADTSNRDLAIGGVVFLILLAVYFFVRGAYVHHLVRKRVAPSSAGNAGWLLFVGLGFLSAAAVLAIINASRFLTFAVTGPLVLVGVVALIASLFIGRR